jgi:hypothetical protein
MYQGSEGMTDVSMILVVDDVAANLVAIEAALAPSPPADHDGALR